MIRNSSLTFLFAALVAIVSGNTTAQTDTTFTYQGELQQNGSPANGSINLGFSLWDSEVGGNLVSEFSLHSGVPVVDGKISVEIDLGAAVFNNSDRWLRITVNGVALTPRQPVTRTPYAIQTRGIFVSDSGRRVGIGTILPDEELSVHSSFSSCDIRVSSSATGTQSGLRMGVTGSGDAIVTNDYTGSGGLLLGTNGFNDLSIEEDGRVGINMYLLQHPDQVLHVRQAEANKAIRIQHQSTVDDFYWETGVGTNTRNYKFIYNGLGAADISSTDGAYIQLSDRRVKRDIQDLPSVLDKVTQLKPATYHYLDSPEGAPRSTGFIAQDVEHLFPNLVRESDDGHKGLIYDAFAVISIKAIQELDLKDSQLEQENAELRTQMDSLKQLVEQLAADAKEQSK